MLFVVQQLPFSVKLQQEPLNEKRCHSERVNDIHDEQPLLSPRPRRISSRQTPTSSSSQAIISVAAVYPLPERSFSFFRAHNLTPSIHEPPSLMGISYP